MSQKLYAVLGAAAIAAGAAAWMATRPYSISQADLDNIKGMISAEYAKRESHTVEEVSLLRASPTTATGFTKFRIGQLPVVTHTCQITMNPDDGKMLWNCKP